MLVPAFIFGRALGTYLRVYERNHDAVCTGIERYADIPLFRTHPRTPSDRRHAQRGDGVVRIVLRDDVVVAVFRVGHDELFSSMALMYPDAG